MRRWHHPAVARGGCESRPPAAAAMAPAAAAVGLHPHGARPPQQATPATLTPRAVLGARAALVSFLFDDDVNPSADPVLERGGDWCAWDPRGTGNDRDRVHVALAPGATHVAAARGRRLAVVSAVPVVAGDQNQPGVSPSSSVESGQLCDAEVPDAAARGEHVTAVCWISFMAMAAEGGSSTSSLGRSDGSERSIGRAGPAVHDLCVAVGTSRGRLRVFAPDGHLLVSQRLDAAPGGSDGGEEEEEGGGGRGGVSALESNTNRSAVRALHLRDARRSASRDDPAEDLTAVLDAAVVRVDALELRSVVRRAMIARERSDKTGDGIRSSEVASAGIRTRTPQLATTRWDLSRLPPLADAVCVGRLAPTLSEMALAPSVASGGGNDAGGRLRRGVGILAAGVGDPRGSSGIVSLLAAHEDRENILEAATALASKAASTAVSAVSTLFGGAVGLAGKVTASLPVGRALGGAVVGAVGAAGNAVGSAAARAVDADASLGDWGKTPTWRSAMVDPPRRVRRLVPAPRGPICAAADCLGRIVLFDLAAPSMLTAARVLKGCRDAEVAWVEAPPPRGANARRMDAAGGLGSLHLAVRNPHRNGGAVELWEVSGGGGGNERKGDAPVGNRTHAGGTGGGCVRLLQAATPLCAGAAAGSEATVIAAAKCYLLSAGGVLSEVSVGVG